MYKMFTRRNTTQYLAIQCGCLSLHSRLAFRLLPRSSLGTAHMYTHPGYLDIVGPEEQGGLPDEGWKTLRRGPRAPRGKPTRQQQ